MGRAACAAVLHSAATSVWLVSHAQGGEVFSPAGGFFASRARPGPLSCLQPWAQPEAWPSAPRQLRAMPPVAPSLPTHPPLWPPTHLTPPPWQHPATFPPHLPLQIVMDWLGQLLGLPEAFLSGSSEGKGGGVIQGSASEATLVRGCDPAVRPASGLQACAFCALCHSQGCSLSVPVLPATATAALLLSPCCHG